MADQITTISDKSQFSAVFKNYFQGKDVFIKTKSGSIQIQFLGYSDDIVAFRIPRVKSSPETMIAFTRHGDSTIYASLKRHESNEDTFMFMPIKFQIISETRKEDRQLVDMGSEGTNVIYLTNIMSDMLIYNALSMNVKKVDQAKEMVLFDLK